MSNVCDVLILDDDSEVLIVDDGSVEVVDLATQGPSGPPGTTNPVQFALTYAATITINWEPGDIATLTLNGNTTISMIGTRKKCLLVVTQGATPSNITWDAATVGFGTDVANVPLSTGVGKTDYVGFIKNVVTGKFDIIGYSRGY